MSPFFGSSRATVHNMEPSMSELQQQQMNASTGSDSDSGEPGINPFAALDHLQEEWRSRERQSPWSTDTISEPDLDGIDWREYNPPAILCKAPIVTSQTLFDIISTSIDNIKTRVAEEVRQQREQEEIRLRAVEEERNAAPIKLADPEPYLPIVIGRESLVNAAAERGPGNPSNLVKSVTQEADLLARPSPEHIESGSSSRPSLTKQQQPGKFAIRRIFQRNADKGESSSMGSAREALRKKLDAGLMGVNVDLIDSGSKEGISFRQKSKTALTPSPEDLVECVSCLDDVPRDTAIQVPCHCYCRDCFVRLVSAALQNEQQWPPKCCLNQISFRLILRHIPDDLKRTFQKRSSEWEIPITERMYCHQAECSLWIQPGKINLAHRRGRCAKGHLTCSICRGPHHGRGECPQDHDMHLTNILAEEEGWKRCLNCNALVEHRADCQHMTCRCGTQFCYVCGRRWRTCRCTMQQLAAVKEAASNRREQRRLRDEREIGTSEAEELRAILAQIEEFEKEEARQAELERVEQVRLAELRWQRQIKERIRQETRRRKEIEAKYSDLRHSLNQLNDSQRAMLRAMQEDDAAGCEAESEKTEQQLQEHHKTESEELDAQVLSKLAIKNDIFTKEYASRVAQEKKIQESYHLQLRAFWCGKTGGDKEVDMAMVILKKRMDQSYRTWQTWKTQKLDMYLMDLEEEVIIRKELMHSALEQMRSQHQKKQMDLRSRAAAEKKWMREVILERERLLGAGEFEEMVADTDSLFAAD